MNKITYEVKTEKSLKVILLVMAIGIMLNALPVVQKLLFSDANAIGTGQIHRVALCDSNGYCGWKPFRAQ